MTPNRMTHEQKWPGFFWIRWQTREREKLSPNGVVVNGDCEALELRRRPRWRLSLSHSRLRLRMAVGRRGYRQKRS